MSRFWDHHAKTIDPRGFRANDQYLWQPDHYPYEAIVAHLVSSHRGKMLDMGEDGSHGAVTRKVGPWTVSRDLLDSCLEIAFLEEHLPRFGVASLLDIGAGYGRLARRLKQRHPELRVQCTDAVPVSLDCCRAYRDHCGMSWSVAEPMSVRWDRVDVAVNIHSWSECERGEVDWWAHKLWAAQVPWLFVIPHGKDFSTRDAYDAGTTQRDGNGGGEFRSVIGGHGYVLHTAREDWVDGRSYYLFRLEGT